MEERLERLTKQINGLDLDSPMGCDIVETLEVKADSLPLVDGAPDAQIGPLEASESSSPDSISGRTAIHISQFELQNLHQDSCSEKDCTGSAVLDPELEKQVSLEEPVVEADSSTTDSPSTKQFVEKHLPNSVLPLLRYQQCESSESSSR